MANRLNDPRCQSCCFPDKVKKQRACIVESQEANRRYKYKLNNLEITNNNLKHKLTVYETMLPEPIQRWLMKRYYKKMRKEKINELRSFERPNR